MFWFRPGTDLVGGGVSGVCEKVKKAYLFKGGCVAPKKRNAFASPSDVLIKIGRAIHTILT